MGFGNAVGTTPVPKPQTTDAQRIAIVMGVLGGGLLLVFLVAIGLVLLMPGKQNVEDEKVVAQETERTKPDDPQPNPNIGIVNAPTVEGNDGGQKPKPQINEPEIIERFDRQGNPTGRNLGLGRRDSFEGKTVLVWGSGQGFHFYTREDNPMWIALKDLGFKMNLRLGKFDRTWLEDADIFWLFSSDGGSNRMSNADMDAVIRFATTHGKGLYLLADNTPYTYEANYIGGRLFDTSFRGNYQAEKIAYVRERNLEPKIISKFGGQYAVKDHSLLRHVNFFYEGITLSHFKETPRLKTAFYASDNKPLCGISQVPSVNVVVDCGFTRYAWGGNPTHNSSYVTRAAGTIRYGQNISAYLMGQR